VLKRQPLVRALAPLVVQALAGSQLAGGQQVASLSYGLLYTSASAINLGLHASARPWITVSSQSRELYCLVIRVNNLPILVT